MAVLHIVQGGIDNGDKTLIDKAARDGLDTRTWVVPKNAARGDDVVIFFSGFGFYATASIKSRPKPRADWPNRYGAGLTTVKLIEPPISLKAIIRHVSGLTWANYPRSITTPDPEIAERIRKLVRTRRATGTPDLDKESLEKANIDELRRVALLAEKPTATRRDRNIHIRVRSIAIKRYVLLRAKGKCEGCGAPAPFLKPDNSPYLEPHHTHQLSDDGPDHPAKVIALCPNCHSRAHHARDATAFNLSLIKALLKIERRC